MYYISSFTQLHLGQDVTEILTYTFGEGAKFDGFGKTLPHTLANVDKIKELTIGVHIFDMAVTRNVTLSLVQPTGSVSAMAMAALSRQTPTAHLRATPTHGEGFMSPTPLSLQVCSFLCNIRMRCQMLLSSSDNFQSNPTKIKWLFSNYVYNVCLKFSFFPQNC